MESKGKQHLRIPVWVSFLLIILGLILASLQAGKYFRDDLSHQWPSVEGVMLRSEWVGSSGSRKAIVAYRYKVNGQTYHSETIALWPCSAERLVKSHPAGSPVNVRYDETQPERAVLIPGGSILGPIGIAGATCLLIGCWSWIDTLRLRAQKRNSVRAP